MAEIRHVSFVFLFLSFIIVSPNIKHTFIECLPVSRRFSQNIENTEVIKMDKFCRSLELNFHGIMESKKHKHNNFKL